MNIKAEHESSGGPVLVNNEQNVPRCSTSSPHSSCSFSQQQRQVWDSGPLQGHPQQHAGLQGAMVGSAHAAGVGSVRAAAGSASLLEAVLQLQPLVNVSTCLYSKNLQFQAGGMQEMIPMWGVIVCQCLSTSAAASACTRGPVLPQHMLACQSFQKPPPPRGAVGTRPLFLRLCLGRHPL